MRYEYIEPLVSTSMRVLNVMIPGTTRRGEVSMLPAGDIRGEVSVKIGITGDNDGDIIITMASATAVATASLLLGSRVDSLTADALDALAELGNMIAGNALSALNDLGFDFTLETASVSAHGIQFASGMERESLQIPLASSCGELNMNVLLGTD